MSFGHKVDFEDAQFDTIPVFTQAMFRGSVSFQGARFAKGVDFRHANFDTVAYFDLAGFDFPDGTLQVYWDQWKGRGQPRIRGDEYSAIQILYHKLRDNYLKQGNQASADAVMYELGRQRERMLNEGR